MKTKKEIDEIIKKHTVPINEVFKDFTDEDKKHVKFYAKYYKTLMELRELRKKLGLTQEELAKKADVPRTTISKIETGDHNPTLETLMTIAFAMGKQLKIKLL